MKPLVVGLRARLVAAVFVVLAGLLAVIAVLVVLRAERALLDTDERRCAAVTEQLAQSIRYAVLARSEALLTPTLDSFAHTPDLVDVTVLDETGGMIASRSGVERAAAAIAITVPVYTQGTLPDELGAFGLNASAPRLVGRIHARFAGATTRRIQAQMRRDIISAFVLIGCVGLAGILLLASTVVGRIRRLMVAAQQVAQGRLESTVTDAGSDELSQLTRAFNTMTHALAQQRHALDQAAAQLAERESLAAIGRATAVIAHEIRNPLGILLGASQIVGNLARPEADHKQAAAMIEQEVRRLERTLDGLLGYARPKRPSRTRVDVLELCRKARERATFEGGPAQGLRIEVSGRSAPALVDEQQAAQILLNLISNAAQAGARTIRMTVADGRAVQVGVDDDGSGVAHDVAPQLFRPFVTTKQQGAGLGLAASRRMARDNGGDLVYVPDKPGAHFVLSLERAPEETDP